MKFQNNSHSKQKSVLLFDKTEEFIIFFHFNKQITARENQSQAVDFLIESKHRLRRTLHKNQHPPLHFQVCAIAGSLHKSELRNRHLPNRQTGLPRCTNTKNRP